MVPSLTHILKSCHSWWSWQRQGAAQSHSSSKIDPASWLKQSFSRYLTRLRTSISLRFDESDNVRLPFENLVKKAFVQFRRCHNSVEYGRSQNQVHRQNILCLHCCWRRSRSNNNSKMMHRYWSMFAKAKASLQRLTHNHRSPVQSPFSIDNQKNYQRLHTRGSNCTPFLMAF